MKKMSIKTLLVIGILIVISSVSAHDILIKIDTSKAFSANSLKAANIEFTIQPLLKNSRFQGEWFVAKPATRTEMSAWDLAHKIAEENAEVVYAEPDQSQINKYYNAFDQRQETGGDSRAYDDTWSHPKSNIFAWHLDTQHSQLKKAREEVGNRNDKRRIRIGHFDTGYDPKHVSTPLHVCSDLEKNFVEGENENSAIDPGIKDGILQQPGHGTATLAIAAGNRVQMSEMSFDDYLGGAPHTEVVPVRLSKSVVLIQTSAFAKALFHAVDVKCDVVTMSMGGVASKLWGEAVNKAYENGVTVVTAGGNNFRDLPTRYLVYPAKFKRVVAVCGATFDNSPYWKSDLLFFKMQGNWGPEKLMESAIGAYTPNMPWAKLGKVTDISVRGGGTSSATPQVAAAAALWLQKYIDTEYEHPWQRVNAVRHALFSSAYKGAKDSKKYYGNGILRASEALKVAPKLDIPKIPVDKVENPFISILTGAETFAGITNKEMLEVELLQLEQNNPELRKLLESLEGKQDVSEEFRQSIIRAVREIPETSQAFLNALKK